MTTASRTKSADLSVTRTATPADAALIVQLMNGRLAERASDGMDVLWAYDKPPTFKQFDSNHPHGSPGAKAVDAVLNLNEMIGTLVKQGLLDRALVYDLLWVKGVWERCSAIALHHREKAANPAIYENFESLAKGQS